MPKCLFCKLPLRGYAPYYKGWYCHGCEKFYHDTTLYSSPSQKWIVPLSLLILPELSRN